MAHRVTLSLFYHIFFDCLHLSNTCFPLLSILYFVDISLYNAKCGGFCVNGHSLSKALICSLDHFLLSERSSRVCEPTVHPCVGKLIIFPTSFTTVAKMLCYPLQVCII